MAISRSEFNFRIGQLQDLDFGEATPRLAGFLDWLDRDSKGAAILQELRSREIQAMWDASGDQTPPKPKTPEDVAAIAVRIIESAARAETEIFQIGSSIGVRAPSSRIQDSMDEISRRYIRPLLDYLGLRLFDSGEDDVTAEVLMAATTNTRDVFVVHGRDEGVKQTVARFLEHLGLNAIILHEQSNRGRTVIEKFEDHAEVQFAVVILTPDDIGRLAMDPETSGTFRARQNVIFEMGYFIGRIGRNGVFPLCVGEVDIPSDYAGVVYTKMDRGGAWKVELIRELKSAGFDIDANEAFE